MDRYFPVEDGFDFLSALSILTKQGHIVVMNWAGKETYPKKEGKGAAKPFWPVIGLAILSKESFLQFRSDVPLTERFKSDSWFARLSIGSEKELKELLKAVPVKPTVEEDKKAEELKMYSLF